MSKRHFHKRDRRRPAATDSHARFVKDKAHDFEALRDRDARVEPDTRGRPAAIKAWRSGDWHFVQPRLDPFPAGYRLSAHWRMNDAEARPPSLVETDGNHPLI